MGARERYVSRCNHTASSRGPKPVFSHFVVGEWDQGRVGVRLSPWQPFNGMYDSDPEATFGHVVQALRRFPLAAHGDIGMISEKYAPVVRQSNKLG